MTPEYFEKYILEVMYNDMILLCRSKGVEYAGKEDKLANFKKTAAECGIDPMQVCYIFMNKHYNAIQSYIKEKKVYSEPITQRIRDCQLYLALLEGLILEANQEILPALGKSTAPFNPMVGTEGIDFPFKG